MRLGTIAKACKERLSEAKCGLCATGMHTHVSACACAIFCPNEVGYQRSGTDGAPEQGQLQ